MAENNSDEFSFSDAAGQETYEQLEADDTATGDETIASNGAAAVSDEQGVDDPVGHSSRLTLTPMWCCATGAKQPVCSICLCCFYSRLHAWFYCTRHFRCVCEVPHYS